MNQQEFGKPEEVHTGKQVLLRLLLFVGIVIAIVILYKMVIM